MSTSASHGQCSAKASLGQALPSITHRKHTFGRKRIPLRRRVVLHHVLRVQSQAGRGTVKIKEEEEIDVEIESEPSSGTKKFIKLPGTVKLPGAAKLQAKGQSQSKSNKVVFVAGATGKVGSRTVRELLKLGFQVRAGTRNPEKAQALFEDVTLSGPLASGTDDATPFGFFSPAKLFGFLKPKPGKVLEIVECDLEDAESIEPALSNAGTVVCCIGASEKEVLDVSGPYRIDFKATANLIDAASSAQVNHFVLVTSLGTQKLGFPAAALNLFWGVLIWKAKAENALLQSGLPYTIVRPGGMERPTDAYKETHNLVLAEADKLFGGQVSNLQVAELLASIVENPEVSVNKIIEAVAETTAPLRPIRELLEEISAKDDTASSPTRKTRPSKADVAPQKVFKRQEEENLAKEKRALDLKEKEAKQIQAEKLAEEKLAKAQKDKEEKRIRAENDEKEKLRLQALRKKYEEEIEAAREKEEAAKSAAAAALAEKAELEKRVAEIRAKAEAAALAASQAKAVEAAVVAAARKGNVLSDAEKKKILESVRLARLPEEDGSRESKPSSRKKPAFSFFGKAAPSTETATDVEAPKEIKEDQAKAEAESKAKVGAEKEAAAKLAEQKKQEEKARKEAAKKLAEQETAQALEAKQKAEQDKLEKEAKEKAEKEAAEAKRKEEEAEARKKAAAAEAKRKEEEAEARRKEEEAEAKRKELAEAKKKEEQEEAERLKVEAEEKAKAKSEQEAEGKREEAELAKSTFLKGFRWFWQTAEPEEEQRTEADMDEVPVQAKVTEQLPPSSTPLSPYTRQSDAEKEKAMESVTLSTEKAEKEAAEAKRREEEANARKKEEEAETKRKKEEDEARRKEEEAETKRKELAEAKKKEEQEEAERLNVEAEEKAIAKAEQDAEAKRKEAELAEAKKKEEQEKAGKEAERLKVEAEEKAKAQAEQEAAAAAAEVADRTAVQQPQEAEQAPAPAFLKGFRWFWQPAEPAEEQSTKADVAEVPVQAKVTEQLPPSSTPLSPYTRQSDAEKEKEMESVRLSTEKAEKEAAEVKRKEEEANAIKKEEEAEARRKEEEAEARRKEEEAEAKRKELAEAKKKEEQEGAERLKVEAEEKAKAKAEQDAEAKRKEAELAEAKKKEEQEKAERLKVEAEAKAKVQAEQEAAAVEDRTAVQQPREAEQAPAPAFPKGFRWFWQPAEPEEEQSTEVDVAEVPVQAKVIEQLPPSSTPLSPYTRQSDAEKEKEMESERLSTEKAEKEAAEAKRKEEEANARKREEEAEARRKEEEAEAKRKEAAAEAKRKELAEAKKKEEQEEAERLKVEAEEKARAKAKQDAEAKRKEAELAEAKKEEQEKAEKEAEMLKVEAEEKARAQAEQSAEAKRKEAELAEAKKKEEQEKAEKEAEMLKVEAEEKAKAQAEQEAAAVAAAVADKTAVQQPQEAEQALAPAFPKGFRWFWQPAEQEEEQSTEADVAEAPVQAKVTEQLPPSSTPLSPYTRYPGLKPPYPPIASPPRAEFEKSDTPKTELVSSAINRVEQTIEEVRLLAEKNKEVIAKELSPESQEDIEARVQLVQETTAREREAVEKAQAAISLKWLWEKTDSDEECSAPTMKEDSISSSKKEQPAPPVKEEAVGASKSDDLPRSSRPLSPYAQFPNLKPPAPPRPSLPVPRSAAKKFKEIEPLPNSSTPLSPYPGFPDLKPPMSPTPPCDEVKTPPCDEVNGAVPENAVETEETNAESALSLDFKWPWQQ